MLTAMLVLKMLTMILEFWHFGMFEWFLLTAKMFTNIVLFLCILVLRQLHFLVFLFPYLL